MRTTSRKIELRTRWSESFSRGTPIRSKLSSSQRRKSKNWIKTLTKLRRSFSFGPHRKHFLRFASTTNFRRQFLCFSFWMNRFPILSRQKSTSKFNWNQSPKLLDYGSARKYKSKSLYSASRLHINKLTLTQWLVCFTYFQKLELITQTLFVTTPTIRV